MANVGFIGLGIMGRPMAEHLLAAGHQLFTATQYKQPPAALIERGMQCRPTPQAVAEVSEVIILMLPDTPQVEDVLFGPHRLPLIHFEAGYTSVLAPRSENAS